MRMFLGTKMRPVIRAVALTMFFPLLGFLVCFIVEMVFEIEIPRTISAIINFVIAAFAAFHLFPQVLGIPFGKVKTRDFTTGIGFYLPRDVWKHVLLGVVLAVCTLSGMLVASVLSGTYVMDFSTITFEQAVFSLNPGIWEEVFYRGVLLMILLPLTKSIKRAAVVQIVIFGLAHVKDFTLLALVDVVSVMILAIGFTYTAYKTHSLIAGIVLHYLHDTLLFFVQPSGGVTGVAATILFFALLWLMVGVGCWVTKFAAEKLKVRAAIELYTLAPSDEATS
ncbi:MAG: CPBP family intramembrane metalloprotease [Anaerolineae bacterium]|nr:CPBP family intramembrane metalloprotease [Anaerolineae bacterium]